MILQYRKNGLVFLLLENAALRVQVLPQFGGKMVELLNKQTGTQFLLEPAQDYTQKMLPSYGAEYAQHAPGGFDECFPTIRASVYQWNGAAGDRKYFFPDHGELWSIPWTYHMSNHAIYLSVQGVRADYEFKKKITLHEHTVQIDYTLVNLSDRVLEYLWAPQPLLRIHPGCQILLDEGIQRVSLEWTTDAAVGKQGAYLSWPYLDDNRKMDYRIIPEPDIGRTIKLYARSPGSGQCGLHRKDTGERILFKYDTDEFPYIGLWLCYGGWPVNNPAPLYSVAIQPTTSRSDSLQTALERGSIRKLASWRRKNGL